MALRVEDSDDELPELKDLVKSSRAGNGTRKEISTKPDLNVGVNSREGPVTGGMSTRPTKAALNVDSGSVTGKPRKGKSSGETHEGGIGVGKEGKEVKKKRVLNQRADNPLLRPLNARVVSSEPGERNAKPRTKTTNGSNEKVDSEGPRPLLRTTKSRSVPLDEPISEDEKAVAKSRVDSLKGKGVVKGTSEGAKLVLRAKSRSVTPLEEMDSLEEKPETRSKRKAAEPKESKRRGILLHSDSEDEPDTMPRTKAWSTTPQEEPVAQEERPGAKSRTKKGEEPIRSKNRDPEPELEIENEYNFQEEEGAPKSKARKVVESRKSKRCEPVSETEEEEEYGSDGISDFIVNDSTFLVEEDSVIEMPPHPPRSTRKLVQGRRRKEQEESDDNLDLGMKKLNIKDDAPARGSREASEEKDLKAFAEEFSDEEVPTKSVPRKLFGDVRLEPPKKVNDPSSKKNSYVSSSDVEDPFTLRYSPSESKPRKVSKETKFATPPGSSQPKSMGLKSPKKAFQRIPSTPHRQSMDTFWQQDIINDWNDEYSPKKTPGIKPKSTLPLSSKKSPVKADREAKVAKKAFSERKHEIAECFLKELDKKITSGQISKLSASTGGVKIIWSKKLNTTAGRANWKRETLRSSVKLPDGTTALPTHRHHATIELAEKVIDDEDRLLNVIAHEFCHLANFMISNIKNNPHGKEFKIWASKVSSMFAGRGIEVTTKHSYEIDYRYVWECENCGVEFKRHSRSIDPKRHQCGSCKSRLVQTKPAPRAGTGVGGEKKVSEYQVFMKEHMGRIKEENPGSPQKEIMGLVGKRYKEFKASKLGGLESKGIETVVIDEVVGGKEGSPDDKVGEVARKLNFLDLASP
ncbi:uncharacterized protein PAC_07400 [Phialocephala subalpina]|uniref:SprT-like domain-containing protein n=1 Tax=Phialocephala subalpina TaxID=576137 RepID=A0A1L7WXL7_9HELO|nr:uncharacterized protein PAC_07400 [Phialocephala subalpina]